VDEHVRVEFRDGLDDSVVLDPMEYLTTTRFAPISMNASTTRRHMIASTLMVFAAGIGVV